MERYDWTRLSTLQIGKYAEYYVKMEFMLYGFEVYTTEVDDHSVDFVVKIKEGIFYEIQVKSVRTLTQYMYIEKDKFPMSKNRIVAFVYFEKGNPPKLFLIPLPEWLGASPILANRDYDGKKSKPEWGINLSKKNIDLLKTYSFEEVIKTL